MQAFDMDDRHDVKLALYSLLSKDSSNWSTSMAKNLNYLTNQTEAKKGAIAVDNYLKYYGKRRL